MANHKSAAKRARQSLKRSARNLSTKRSMRTTEKNLRTAITKKEGEAAQSLLKAFTSGIAKAAKKGIVHKNAAARKVSRLAQQVKAI